MPRQNEQGLSPDRRTTPDIGIISICAFYFSLYVNLIGMLCSGSSLYVESKTLHLHHS